jgi:hypothetical protein
VIERRPGEHPAVPEFERGEVVAEHRGTAGGERGGGGRLACARGPGDEHRAVAEPDAARVQRERAARAEHEDEHRAVEVGAEILERLAGRDRRADACRPTAQVDVDRRAVAVAEGGDAVRVVGDFDARGGRVRRAGAIADASRRGRRELADQLEHHVGRPRVAPGQAGQRDVRLDGETVDPSHGRACRP